jgi:TP901 family phage tail tape measure protein
MNLSNEDAVQLGKSYNALAKEMSVTTTEIAKAAVEYARQGLSLEQMDDRLRNTIKYAKISGMEFQEAAEIITASVNSMGIETERAVDIFSYMGDATATGADEIGRALQRVGKNYAA